jgi:hypothetical protein
VSHPALRVVGPAETGAPKHGLEILTVREFAERLKVPERTAYLIASELPHGCVLRIRRGVRVVWERALVALAEATDRR